MIRTRCEVVYDCVIKTKEVGPIIPLTSSMLHPSLLSSGRVLLSTLSSGTAHLRSYTQSSEQLCR